MELVYINEQPSELEKKLYEFYFVLDWFLEDKDDDRPIDDDYAKNPLF